MTRVCRSAAGGAAALLLVLAGCSLIGREARLELPPATRAAEERILYSATTWSGSIYLARPIVVARTATLKLLPGTRLYFDLPEPASDKDRKPWILVTGSLAAVGTPEQPILFASVEPRRNELDDMVKVDGAKQAVFRHCSFERGPWALHAHESPVEVTSSLFRGNYGGARFQGGKVVLRDNRFQANTVGIRCLKASPLIEENSFLGNLTGIFFREGIAGAVVKRNNFDDAEYDIKLGEGQTDDVDAVENWWGPPGKGALAERIYDATDAPGLGRVKTDPVLATPFAAKEKGK